MYEIVPTSDPDPDIRYVDTNLGPNVTSFNNVKDKLNLNYQNAPVKTARHSYGEDSGFDDLYESDVTEKTGLFSDISDSSSPDTAQLDKEGPINGIDETGINYHDYATALTDVRREVDKKENGKKKKVRINEDATDISLIPDRFEYCVNYKNGYHGYKQGGYTDKKNSNTRNHKNKCYYRYCFDTHNSGRHHTARWEEEDENYNFIR